MNTDEHRWENSYPQIAQIFADQSLICVNLRNLRTPSLGHLCSSAPHLWLKNHLPVVTVIVLELVKDVVVLVVWSVVSRLDAEVVVLPLVLVVVLVIGVVVLNGLAEDVVVVVVVVPAAISRAPAQSAWS